MSAVPDPGLRAVARVRGVRERDSRIGLVEALTEEQGAAAYVVALLDRLTAAGTGESGDLAGFTARRHALEMVSDALLAARRDLETARVVALAARERWQVDHGRLAAVESLIERRSTARRLERGRADQRTLDAIAEDLWRRRVTQGVST